MLSESQRSDDGPGGMMGLNRLYCDELGRGGVLTDSERTLCVDDGDVTTDDSVLTVETDSALAQGKASFTPPLIADGAGRGIEGAARVALACKAGTSLPISP